MIFLIYINFMKGGSGRGDWVRVGARADVNQNLKLIFKYFTAHEN